jgi:hypothetical protein
VLFEITANISRTERGCQSDWANFRSLGDCLLWAGFFKLKKVDDIFRLLLPTIGYALSLQKNGLGYILGDFFTNSSGHPVCQS